MYIKLNPELRTSKEYSLHKNAPNNIEKVDIQANNWYGFFTGIFLLIFVILKYFNIP